MQIIVQEGEASVSLVTPIQAPDENLRTTSTQSVLGPVKVYYRDFEVVKVEARDGALEITAAAVGAINWIKKDRCYQLKPGG
jgi:hypothetical protein